MQQNGKERRLAGIAPIPVVHGPNYQPFATRNLCSVQEKGEEEEEEARQQQLGEPWLEALAHSGGWPAVAITQLPQCHSVV